MSNSSLPQEDANALEAAFATGDVAALEKQLAALEKSHGQDVTVAVAKARLQAATGQVEEALAHLEQLHAQHAGHPLVVGYLGAVLAGTRAYGKARPLLDGALRAGLDAGAIHHAYGVCLLQAGDALTALKHLTLGVERLPSNPSGFFYMGVALAELRQWDKAAQTLAACIQLAPSYADAFDALARVHVERGDMERAASTVEEGLKHNPNDAELSRLRIQLAADRGDNAGAEAALEAIPDEERTAEDWCNLALFAAGRGSGVETRIAAEAAVKADPTLWRAHYMLGLAMEMDPEVSRLKVVAAYKKAVELGDPMGEAGTRLGFVLSADGPHANPAEAVEVLRLTRKRSKDAAATMLHLALAYARAGNNAGAAEAAQAALAAPDATPSIQDQARRLMTHVETSG